MVDGNYDPVETNEEISRLLKEEEEGGLHSTGCEEGGGGCGGGRGEQWATTKLGRPQKRKRRAAADGGNGGRVSGKTMFLQMYDFLGTVIREADRTLQGMQLFGLSFWRKLIWFSCALQQQHSLTHSCL